MRPFDVNRAIVRQPAETVVDGLRAGDQASPTYGGVAREHAAYVAALMAAGLEVTRLPPLPAFPDSVFVEDPALVFTQGAILLRPGAPSREGEAVELESALRDAFETVLPLTSGYADGGDVLVTSERVFVGLSGRTDRTGAACLVELLGRLGRRAVAVETPAGVLHFKSASSLVDEETVLATPRLAASGVFDGLRLLLTPEGEDGAANALRLNDTVLIAAGYPRTREMLERHGLEVVALETGEIAKIDAGLSCMSLRWQAAG